MNREIKFRGLNKEHNQWLYGYFFKYPNGRTVIYESDSSCREVSSSSVGQYTGLKDKNGTEIYEGDMLQHPNHKTTIVTWDETECGWNIVGYGIHLCEIIGNIHDNPELLK